MIGYLQSNTGVQKKVKIGFSWTTLFFQLFVPLFRRDIKGAFIMAFAIILPIIWLLLRSMPNEFVNISTYLSLLVRIFFAFFYNKFYIEGLIAKGYRPVDNDFANELRRKGIEC